MKHEAGSKSNEWPLGRLLGAVVAIVLMNVSFTPRANAQDADALQVLKVMSDYVASQNTISFAYDTSIEVITPELQKIQFTSSGQMLLARPNKLQASRTGGYADVEFVFDGKTFTVYGKNLNAFTQMEAPGSIDQLVDRLRADYAIETPGADLLLSRVYDELSAGVIDAKHIGRGVIDGVECEHLAFRNQDTDWQLWVEVGDRPVPRKYLIVSKTMAAAPQYEMRIKDWSANVQVNADAFAFTPPPGATNVSLESLKNIDEIPAEIVTGDRQ